jgi:hypothetical protein
MWEDIHRTKWHLIEVMKKNGIGEEDISKLEDLLNRAEAIVVKNEIIEKDLRACQRDAAELCLENQRLEMKLFYRD